MNTHALAHNLVSEETLSFGENVSVLGCVVTVSVVSSSSNVRLMLSLHCRRSLGFRSPCPALWHLFGPCVDPVPVSDDALTKGSNLIPNESLLLP